ncbi:MAG: hypothetical protein J7M19_00675 [Planctomycetes bacterium]|nr:hypothetical protein [Planctomycetota bacterium]
MVVGTDVREIVNDLFEEEALLIGGLIAVHRLDDDFLWRLVKNLDVIRGRFLRRIEDGEGREESAPSHVDLKLHPAIESFLENIRRGRR